MNGFSDQDGKVIMINGEKEKCNLWLVDYKMKILSNTLNATL
jgi:hypothetical protein